MYVKSSRVQNCDSMRFGKRGILQVFDYLGQENRSLFVVS